MCKKKQFKAMNSFKVSCCVRSNRLPVKQETINNPQQWQFCGHIKVKLNETFPLTFYQQNSSSHRRAQIGGKIHLFYIQIKVSLKVNRNAGTIPRWKRTRFGPAQRKLELRIEVIPEGQDQRQWENLRSDTLSHQMLHSFCHSPKRQDRQTRSVIGLASLLFSCYTL